jgi:hypothetical protein
MQSQEKFLRSANRTSMEIRWNLGKIVDENPIKYAEENPVYRKKIDKYFKKIYRDDICDVFPQYNHPKIIEIFGDRLSRVKKLENYL